MTEALQKAKRNIVGEIFAKAGIIETETRDLMKVVALSDALKPKGYTLEMVAAFLVNEKNLDMINLHGLTMVINSALKADFPTIQAKKMKFNRNEPCPCGSGIKFKKCCITKL